MQLTEEQEKKLNINCWTMECRFCKTHAAFTSELEQSVALDKHLAECSKHPIREVERKLSKVCKKLSKLEDKHRVALKLIGKLSVKLARR